MADNILVVPLTINNIHATLNYKPMREGSNSSETPCPMPSYANTEGWANNPVNTVEYTQLARDIGQIINDADLEYKINWQMKSIGFPDQPAEYYYGCREYKRHIIDETEYPQNVNKEAARRKFINKKATQMLFRLNEGGGHALYLIGVEDNGVANGIRSDEVLTTLVNFICMTDIIKGSVVRTFNIYRTLNAIKTKTEKYVCTFRIMLNPRQEVDTCAVI